jgi:hypothetical protein
MTDRFGTKHQATKITEIDEHSVMACEGSESYMAALIRHVKKAVNERKKGEDLADVLVRANESYCKEIGPPLKLAGKTSPSVGGLFAAYDTRRNSESRFRLFALQPPDPPTPRIGYASGGSGYISADFVLQKADYFLAEAGTNWSKMSGTSILRFSYILLRMIETYHADVSGSSFFLIDGEKKPKSVSPREIFPSSKPFDPTRRREQLGMLIESLIQDVGKDNFLRLAQAWGLIQKLEEAGLRITWEGT